MPSFDFIGSEEFRLSLVSDFHEMEISLKSGAWKATQVLAGSIIEAVLVDYIISENILPKDEALNLDLGKALILCKTKGIITQKTLELSGVIKEYRNYIHPGRIIRLKEKLSKDTASVSIALVNIIVDIISKKRQENYGYTAENIIQKLESDSTAITILPHLLKDVKLKEIEKLLLKSIPDRYISTFEDEAGYTPTHLRSSLSSCFRMAFKISKDDLKRIVAAKYISILKESSDFYINVYENEFFRCTDLKYISRKNQPLVTSHLLSKLKTETDLKYISVLIGIGKYLKQDDMMKFIDPLIMLYLSSGDSEALSKLEFLIDSEYSLMNTKLKTQLENRIGQWIVHLRKSGNVSGADKIDKLRDSIVLPF